MTKKLAQLQDKKGNARLNSAYIERIVSSADTPEKAQLKFDLTGKLAQLEDKNGNTKLNSVYIERIVSSADTPEKAQLAFLNVAVEVIPKEILKYDIPKSVSGLDSFYPIAEKMAANEELTKAETLNFLNKNSTDKKLDALIELVDKNAVE